MGRCLFLFFFFGRLWCVSLTVRKLTKGARLMGCISDTEDGERMKEKGGRLWALFLFRFLLCKKKMMGFVPCKE